MTFTQNGDMLMLNISGADVIHVEASVLAGRAISVSITGGRAASATPNPDLLGPAVNSVGNASQREASTSATVRDGDSFVIGGLRQESELSHHNRFPGLGDAEARAPGSRRRRARG